MCAQYDGGKSDAVEPKGGKSAAGDKIEQEADGGAGDGIGGGRCGGEDHPLSGSGGGFALHEAEDELGGFEADGTEHGGHGEEEGKLRRAGGRKTDQPPAEHGCTRTGRAGDERECLGEADAENLSRSECGGIGDPAAAVADEEECGTVGGKRNGDRDGGGEARFDEVIEEEAADGGGNRSGKKARRRDCGVSSLSADIGVCTLR